MTQYLQDFFSLLKFLAVPYIILKERKEKKKKKRKLTRYWITQKGGKKDLKCNRKRSLVLFSRHFREVPLFKLQISAELIFRVLSSPAPVQFPPFRFETSCGTHTSLPLSSLSLSLSRNTARANSFVHVERRIQGDVPYVFYCKLRLKSLAHGQVFT